jgi:hypothetical protein
MVPLLILIIAGGAISYVTFQAVVRNVGSTLVLTMATDICIGCGGIQSIV